MLDNKYNQGRISYPFTNYPGTANYNNRRVQKRDSHKMPLLKHEYEYYPHLFRKEFESQEIKKVYINSPTTHCMLTWKSVLVTLHDTG